MRRLLWLSQWRFLSRQPLPSALLLVGTVLAVAALTAVELLNRHSELSLDSASQQIDGLATHRVANARQDIPDTVYAELRRRWLARWPDLSLAPVLADSVRIDGERWQLLGVDPLSAIQQRKLTALDASVADLGQPLQVAVSARSAAQAGWAIGDQIALNGTDQRLVVGALIQGRDLPQRWLVTDIGSAQHVLQRAGRLSHIDLVVPAGIDPADLMRTLPGGLRLEPVSEILQGRQGLSAAFRFNLRCLALLAFAVVGFLIYGTCQAAFLRRLPTLERLWQMGADHHQLLRGLWLEAALLSALAALPGIALGHWLGGKLASLTGATLRELYELPTLDGLDAGAAASLWPAAMALLIMLICYSLCYQQFRPDRDHRPRPALRRTGALLLLAPGLLLVLTESGLAGAFVGMTLLLLGLLALIPEAMTPLWPLLETTARSVGVIGRVAVRDCRREGARTQVAIAALCLALAASSGVALMIDSFRSTLGSWLDQQLPADLFLFGDIASANLQALGALDSIAHLTPRQFTTLTLYGVPLELTAQTPPPAHRQLPLLSGATDAWAQFAQGAVLISEPLARRRKLGAGDTIRLPGDDGPRDFTIAGVFRDYGNEHGRVLMDLASYRRHWQDPGISSLAIELRPGVDPDTQREAIAQALGEDPGQRLVARDLIRERALAVFEQTFAVTQALRLLVLGIALAAIISSLVIYQQFRARQLATLQALGMDRGQGHRLFFTQALSISASAGVLALPLGWLVAWLLVNVINPRGFGWSFPLDLTPLPGLQSLGLALLCGALAALYPCWRFARTATATSLHRD